MLSEYKDEIGMAAGFFTLIQLFSPLVLCRDIVKRRSSAGVDLMPFLGGLILSSIFIQHALLNGDSVMFNVNMVGFSLSIIYLTMYYLYTKEKVKFYIKLSKAVIFVIVLISYAQRENADVVKFRFGLITTFVLLTLISAPLLSVGTILETRNTDSLPMPLIISGTVVTFSWYLHGLAVNDTFLQIQNMIALVVQAFQIGLFIYVKLQKPVKKGDKKD